MIDAGAFRELLVGYGPTKVRQMIAERRFNEEKTRIAQEWLDQAESTPQATRAWHGERPSSRYRPTAGDLAYRNAFVNDPDLNPFEEAMLLQGISPAYLSALAHDNSGPRSAGFKAMIDAEVTRRGSGVAKRANIIAICSLTVAIAAAIISVFK